ncbi:MAG: single-stranded-DNA-specific exonuclease RecJ [Acetobacteraceae bacterium]
MLMQEDTAPSPARNHVLDVTHSGQGKAWVWRHEAMDDALTERVSFAMAQKLGLSELTCRLLTSRGIGIDAAETFLSPRLRDTMPDPLCLRDMDRAVACLTYIVLQQKDVGILGDYDVDGGCGTALLTETLRELGCQVHTHIPDRIAEGYGPNAPAIEALLEKGAATIICVDCGTAAMDVLDPFSGRVPMIVLDHHKPDGAPLPQAIIVNPNRLDCDSQLGTLCAAGVVLMTLIAVSRSLAAAGFFETRRRPDLMSKLDLVALATICDVMPLQGLNRALVAQGLKVMAQGRRLGLSTLASVAGVDTPGSATACGFFLGPRLNAGGRIARADLGLKLLLSQDVHEACTLATELDDINARRRDVESAILTAAEAQAEAQIAGGARFIFVHDPSWHPGIVGIVAGRLKERFNCPVFVGAEKDGVIKGSARSVPGLDVGLAVINARQKNLLTTGGGHAMAAGFGLLAGRAADLHAFLDAAFTAQASQPRVAVMPIDAVMPLRGAHAALAHEIARLAPFGAGNDEPVLAIPRLRCVKCDRIGRDGNTLRVIMQDESGNRLKGLVFRAADKAFCALLEDRSMKPLHIAGHLKCDMWQGQENLTFFICDAAPVGA